jgi:hypothetical protein
MDVDRANAVLAIDLLIGLRYKLATNSVFAIAASPTAAHTGQ